MHHGADDFARGEKLAAVVAFLPIFSSKPSYTCDRVKK